VIANVRKDGSAQTLEGHLNGVAQLAGVFAAKFGLTSQVELISLLHDPAICSAAFQAWPLLLAN